MKKLMNVLLRNPDRILKIFQIAALLWIGLELHGLARNVYSGPGPDDGVDLTQVEEQLGRIVKAINLK
ncbi:hypothetical protein [Glaciimonas sp. PAMC28666]|uniref:hypothetical protein n=1 Tax=Glaciimonas sp. PAMC28666 TaxID=2807626 RepID=UPI0019626991|nr:hypothetical protein [Glaciimonas sp. PAMC28666]QRX84270.1 hypothetical protein JQN73_08840 [Glaciimonas sp. PAMC28666]